MSLPEPKVPFILASGSPRRKELLTQAGLSFTTQKIDVEEIVRPGLKPLEVVDELALKKLEACGDLLKENLVITADTLVFKDEEILGKPRDREDAVRMLKLLSATDHYVTTSVCLGYQDKIHQFNVTTTVYFKHISEDSISYYIDTYEPYDKAGSYGIQEWIGLVAIDRIEGSYTNVVGLPVAETYQAIVEVGERWDISAGK